MAKKKTKHAVPKSLWKWYGAPGHFCGGKDCRFHLTTEIGRFLVSTVGNYWPPSLNEMTEIGYERYYETMVFRFKGRCEEKDCGCGQPIILLADLDMVGYQTGGEACFGHMAMCDKWSRK